MTFSGDRKEASVVLHNQHGHVAVAYAVLRGAAYNKAHQASFVVRGHHNDARAQLISFPTDHLTHALCVICPAQYAHMVWDLRNVGVL